MDKLDYEESFDIPSHYQGLSDVDPTDRDNLAIKLALQDSSKCSGVVDILIKDGRTTLSEEDITTLYG
jgi:hypothetical protein